MSVRVCMCVKEGERVRVWTVVDEGSLSADFLFTFAHFPFPSHTPHTPSSLMIKHFNAVSGWVTSSIVSQIRRSQRVEMLKK